MAGASASRPIQADGAPAAPPPCRTVAVIGAGLSGLVAAKCLAQAGLFPTVFDRRPWTGGMWSPASDATYHSLRTNVTRFTCSFSDFPWPPPPQPSPSLGGPAGGAPPLLFPTAGEVSDYLSAYAAAFLKDGGNCALELGCAVMAVKPAAAAGHTAAAAAGHAAAAAGVPAADGGVACGGTLQPPPLPGPWRVTWQQHAAAAAATASSAAAAVDTAETAAADAAGPSKPQQLQRVFDFVVVATGSSAAPYAPPIPGLESFPGLVMHGSEYRGPESVAGARAVAVVGGSASAVDIAADLAMPRSGHTGGGSSDGHGGGDGSGSAGGAGAAGGWAAAAAAAGASVGPDVHHFVSRRFWVVPRSIPQDPASACSAFVPPELLLYRRCLRPPGFEDREILFWDDERCVQSNEYWASVCGDQGASMCPALAIPPDSTELPLITMSETYPALAAAGHIKVHCGRRLTRVDGPTLHLSPVAPPPTAPSPTASEDGAVGSCGEGSTLTGVDAIVLCTGYRPELGFLPPALLDAISYDPNDPWAPVALHRGVTYLDVQGLAFVGMWRSPYFAIIEPQARMVAALFSGALAPEPQEVQRAGISEELAVRAQRPRPWAPHADYVGYADSLARVLGVLPPAAWSAQHEVVVPAHYGAFPSRPAPAPVGAAQQQGEGDDSVTSTAGEDEPVLGADGAAAGGGGLDPAVARGLEDAEAAWRNCMAGAGVPGAVFRALAGTWRLRRRIASNMEDSTPSGTVEGSATFTPLPPPPQAAAGAPAPAGPNGSAGSAAPSTQPPPPLAAEAAPPGFVEYLYSEQGEFVSDAGSARMHVQREYVYSYEPHADRIDTHFAQQGGGRGRFFHTLQFVPQLGQEPPAPYQPQGVGADGAGGGAACPMQGSGSGTVPEGNHGAAAGWTTVEQMPPVLQQVAAGWKDGDGGRRAGAGWRAVGVHPCGQDVYHAAYCFEFKGVQLSEFEVEFHVKGPRKDCVATAVYTRPARV